MIKSQERILQSVWQRRVQTHALPLLRSRDAAPSVIRSDAAVLSVNRPYRKLSRRLFTGAGPQPDRPGPRILKNALSGNAVFRPEPDRMSSCGFYWNLRTEPALDGGGQTPLAACDAGGSGSSPYPDAGLRAHGILLFSS